MNSRIIFSRSIWTPKERLKNPQKHLIHFLPVNSNPASRVTRGVECKTMTMAWTRPHVHRATADETQANSTSTSQFCTFSHQHEPNRDRIRSGRIVIIDSESWESELNKFLKCESIPSPTPWPLKEYSGQEKKEQKKIYLSLNIMFNPVLGIRNCIVVFGTWTFFRLKM